MSTHNICFRGEINGKALLMSTYNICCFLSFFFRNKKNIYQTYLLSRAMFCLKNFAAQILLILSRDFKMLYSPLQYFNVGKWNFTSMQINTLFSTKTYM